MNISRNWLARYVTIDCDLETLCDKLTMAGIEVEAVESAGTVPAGVVTGVFTGFGAMYLARAMKKLLR